MNKLRFKNILFEAALAADRGHEGRALRCLDEARLMLIEPSLPPKPAPENDPGRPGFDREAWRKAKGA